MTLVATCSLDATIAVIPCSVNRFSSDTNVIFCVAVELEWQGRDRNFMAVELVVASYRAAQLQGVPLRTFYLGPLEKSVIGRFNVCGFLTWRNQRGCIRPD